MKPVHVHTETCAKLATDIRNHAMETLPEGFRCIVLVVASTKKETYAHVATDIGPMRAAEVMRDMADLILKQENAGT